MKKPSSLEKGLPPPFSAAKRAGHAFHVTSQRLPVILVKLIDFFHRQRNSLHQFVDVIDPEAISADVKVVMSELVRLRKELETNKPMTPFSIHDKNSDEYHDNHDDLELWNRAIQENKPLTGDLPQWFDCSWLFAECFLYRKIYDILLASKHLKALDPFIEFKRKATLICRTQMALIGDRLLTASQRQPSPDQRDLELFVQLSLWANKCDLSVISMQVDQANWPLIDHALFESVSIYKENILHNDISRLWSLIKTLRESLTVKATEAEPLSIDFVASNSGFELFTDLSLMHMIFLLISSGYDSPSRNKNLIKFRIHVKRCPWFVSDATVQDVAWLLDYMRTSDIVSLENLSADWMEFFNKKIWNLCEHLYWTLPYEYSEMSHLANDLFANLKNSTLIIFKGDLNYRKLVGDRSWPMTTPLIETLGCFRETPILAIRALKSEALVGIEDESVIEKINNNLFPKDWATSGNFGLVQSAQVP